MCAASRASGKPVGATDLSPIVFYFIPLANFDWLEQPWEISLE